MTVSLTILANGSNVCRLHKWVKCPNNTVTHYVGSKDQDCGVRTRAQSEPVPAVNADQSPMMGVAVDSWLERALKFPTAEAGGLRTAAGCEPKPTWIEANTWGKYQYPAHRAEPGLRKHCFLPALRRWCTDTSSLQLPNPASSHSKYYRLAFT